MSSKEDIVTPLTADNYHAVGNRKLHFYLIRLARFIILVLLQVLVLNHIHFEQYATPLFYIYFLLKIDSDNSRKGLMLWAFSLGLCIDIFSNTPGLNAATAVCTAFCRKPGYLLQFGVLL